MVIGLCGGSGSGKSYLAAIAASVGAVVIDADHLAKQMMQPGETLYQKVSAAFDVLQEDGQIDRQKLANIVFADKEKLQLLDRLTHDEITKQIAVMIHGMADAKCIIIDAAALLGSGIEALCDDIVGVTAPYEVRLQRIMKRDGITEAQARLRMDAQTDLIKGVEALPCVVTNKQEFIKLLKDWGIDCESKS